mgnify:CR=1 FL=1
MKSDMSDMSDMSDLEQVSYAKTVYGQEEIARLLASAKRTPIPKRYPQYTPDISRDVRQIISELDDSRKKKRLLGSSIDFPNSRFEVEGF